MKKNQKTSKNTPKKSKKVKNLGKLQEKLATCAEDWREPIIYNR